jgi:TonB family protein
MFRSFTLLALAITIFSSALRVAAAQVSISGKPKALAIYAPRPHYPYEAREKGITGHGVAILSVDPRTGIVKAVRMEPSTGHKILDDAALEAFRQWRFKPGSVPEVNVPIRFVMNRVPPNNLGGVHNAVYTARPLYPAEARSKRWIGTGVVLVDVDQKTGQVTSARMLQSTGHQVLDEAALNAFRQWRFKAGTAREVNIPITFTMRGASY